MHATRLQEARKAATHATSIQNQSGAKADSKGKSITIQAYLHVSQGTSYSDHVHGHPLHACTHTCSHRPTTFLACPAGIISNLQDRKASTVRIRTRNQNQATSVLAVNERVMLWSHYACTRTATLLFLPCSAPDKFPSSLNTRITTPKGYLHAKPCARHAIHFDEISNITLRGVSIHDQSSYIRKHPKALPKPLDKVGLELNSARPSFPPTPPSPFLWFGFC